MSSTFSLSDLQAYVTEIVKAYGTPALSVAIWHDSRLISAAAGVLNIESGVEATIDSVFQIGSITKIFTASLVMLLVDEGKIELDKPVKYYIPSFHVADPDATEAITLRQLLSHTSGLISDPSLSPDDPYDEESAIARYVDRCFLLPQVHKQLGDRFSYSNAAYVIAGRVVEVVLGVSWCRAIEKYIFKPLNMTRSVARPLEALRFRAAMGHFVKGRGQEREVIMAPHCYLTSGAAPAGSTVTMSAPDLVKFGLVHLAGGKNESGGQWMSPESVRTMQEAQIVLPESCATFESGWGLGWNLFNRQGVRGFGHGGGTVGQEAFLEVIPAHDCVFAVQANSTRFPSLSVVRRVVLEGLYELAGVTYEDPKPVRQIGDLTRYTGQYSAGVWRFEISEKEGMLCGQVAAEGVAAPLRFGLEPIGEGIFSMSLPHDDQLVPDHVTFSEPDHRGFPRYLFWGYRLHSRIHH